MAEIHKIRNRFTNEIIVEREADSLGELLESEARNGTNLSGAALSGGQESDLSGVRLDNARIEAADFSGMRLKGASFRGANLSGSLFYQTDLTKVDFTGADLSACDMSGARLRGVILNNATTTGAKIPPRLYRLGSWIALITPLVMITILAIGGLIGISGLIRLLWNALFSD